MSIQVKLNTKSLLQSKLLNFDKTTMLKRVCFSIALLLVVNSVFATDYYISSSAGNDNNDGTSVNTPWQTLAKIKQSSFSAGDKILLKKGDVWYENFKIYSSGTVDKPIIISSYGTGNKPIINVVKSFNTINWVNLGNNIWSTSDIPYNPKRLLKDDIEILDAAKNREQELGTNIPDLVEWYYDNLTKTLKIYTVDSPLNHDIKFSSKPYAIVLSNLKDIVIDGIEFIGGYAISVAFSSCTRITIKNSKIGEFANYGIQMGAYKVNGVNFQLSDSITIDNCIIDSKYTFDYSLVGAVSGASNRGPREGVLFRGTLNCVLRNSLVKNYCHANINIFAPATKRGGTQLDERVVKNSKIYNNVITSPDIAYGGRVAIDGFCFNNEIYNNLLIDISVQNQFNGYENHIHHNIFKRIKNSPLKSYATGNAVGLQGYYIATYGNIIENNLMIDCESAGYFISGNNSYGDVTKNIFRNNIIYNCGTVDNNIGLRVNKDSNTYSNSGNIIQNNVVYNDSSDQTVYFYGKVKNSINFNYENNTNKYKINANIADNPLFIDIAKGDYHLQSNSPCINAGIIILATTDRDENTIPFSSTLPDIGVYEFQNVLNNPEESLLEIHIYPNPIQKTFRIHNYSNENFKSLTIFDIVGKEVFSNYLDLKSNNYAELDISNLQQGIYMLILKSDTNTYIKKIIKK